MAGLGRGFLLGLPEAGGWLGKSGLAKSFAKQAFPQATRRKSFLLDVLETIASPEYAFRMVTEFANVFSLGRAERLQLVEDLWDSLACDLDTPLPDWKRDELRIRKEQYTQNKDTGIPWAEVKQRARDSKGR